MTVTNQEPSAFPRLTSTVAAAEARKTHDVSYAMASTSVGPCIDEVIGSAFAISRKKFNQAGKHQMSEDGNNGPVRGRQLDNDEY